MSKRPIDAHRDGAFSMSVGTAEEGAPGEVFATEEGWYITKPNAIYKIQLADHIDPERRNLSVPNVQQKVYSIGYFSELVCRSVLTVRALITLNRFGEERHKEALAISLRILDGLIAMRNIQDEFVTAEDEALAKLDLQRREDRSLSIPSVGDLDGRVKRFLQHAEHCFQDLFRIGTLFYKVEQKWVDGLMDSIKRQHTDVVEEEFETFESLIKFMKFIRNARNCIEHPRPDQLVTARDFRLSQDVQVVPPTVKIVHPQTPEPETEARIFFHGINESVLNVIESFVACICGFNVAPFGVFPIQVMPLPEEKRQNKLVKFGYAIGINGEWQPLQ